MTKLLSRAFEKAADLSESLQDELARELLVEIEWEQKWEQTLKNSPEKVDLLADQALREYKAGKTTEAGMDSL